MKAVSSGVSATGATGPHVLRGLNAAAVLTAVRRTGVARVADLIAGTGLTRPTVTQAVAALERAGWVETVAEGSTRAAPRLGRPAQQIRFRAEAGHVIGVDVGPHKILTMIADLAGVILAQSRRDVAAAHDPSALVAAVTTAIDTAIADAGLTCDSALAVAVGTPGVVADGEILLSPSIAGWAGTPLGSELSRRFNCPIHVDNDVNLAALAERWRGVSEAVDTVAFIHWGARLGAGLMIGGRLHRGASAAAGEIGFVDLAEMPTPRPGPGGLGPLEAMIGADAIATLARETVRRQPGRLRTLLRDAADERDVSPVFTCADGGDPTALGIVDEIAARFARGLAPLFLLLDPDIVVIGGGVSRGGQVLLDAVQRHLRSRTLLPPRVVLSTLGDTSVAVGAVRLALDDVEERLFCPAALSGDT